MKKENKGISLISLIIIILTIVVMIISGYFIFIYNDIGMKIGLNLQVLTKQINVEEELKNNEVLMGVTEVNGEGIIININDGGDLIHQEDLLILVDELKNSGSQAISINGVRIVNTTYIFCDGTVILIDGIKIGNPFTIKAIGNKDLIYGALTRNGGYIETLNKDKIEINIEKSELINIEKSNKKDIEQHRSISNNVTRLYESNKALGKIKTSGKGLEIVIIEEKAKLTALTFLQMINDLNSAGAEAISINGNRVTNMTDAMDISKKYVLLDSNLISSPYVIKVIGNTENLTKKIRANNSYFSKIENSGNLLQIMSKRLTVEQYIPQNGQSKMLVNYLK